MLLNNFITTQKLIVGYRALCISIKLKKNAWNRNLIDSFLVSVNCQCCYIHAVRIFSKSNDSCVYLYTASVSSWLKNAIHLFKMSLSKCKGLLRFSLLSNSSKISASFIRNARTTKSGGILPEPQKTPFGLLGVVCAVVPGLLIGATISKNIANFLEENDLFVPSDDDDDDD